MDIYKFLNSKDEAAYLKSIDYRFKPVELAFIVYISGKVTFRQKIKAWQEILTMPNCDMPKRRNYWHEDNLHDFLKGIIAEWKRCEKEYLTASDCIYAYKYRDVDYDWQYLSLEELMSDLKTDLDDEDLKYGYTIRKQQLHSPFKVWEVSYNKQHQIIDIDFRCKDTDLNARTADPHSLGFEGLWLDIPSPFRKGDILIDKAAVMSWSEPFVLLDCANWTEEILREQGECDSKEIERNNYLRELHQKDGDYTDMSTYALFADKDTGKVYHDHPMTFIDFEYYRGKLDGGYANLKTISNYIKKGWGLEYLLTNYGYHVDKCRPDGFFPEEDEWD